MIEGLRSLVAKTSCLFGDQLQNDATTINLGPASSFLITGNNVIAVKVQKDEPGDNVRLEMSLKVGTETILNNARNWNYFLGFVESYGGIYENISKFFVEIWGLLGIYDGNLLYRAELVR